MSRLHFFGAGLLVCGLSLPAVAQQWTVEDLDSRAVGFLEGSPGAHLEQIGKLVAAQERAAGAIAARIHGDHREYLLKVERLVGQLTDERWLERERAERTLVEIGGRARGLLSEHSRSGDLLEERIRCHRILERIDARGTEREEQELKLLRGLVSTAFYLAPNERLTRALLSALGHTDSQVVEGAVRALAVHGEGDDANAVFVLMERSPSLRPTALATLARMRGARALELCAQLVDGGGLDTSETIGMIRVLRRRADAAPLMRKLAKSEDRMIAQAASLSMPAEEGEALVAKVAFGDTVISEPLIGIGGRSIVMRSPVEGLGVVELDFAGCDAIELGPEPAGVGGAARVFLTQGSMVTGKVVGMAGGLVIVESPVWGNIELPSDRVQGIAFDPKLDRLIGASNEIDRVRTIEQKLVDGKVVDLDGSTVTLVAADGRESKMARKDVAGILFKRPLQSPPDTTLYTRIDLVSGDRILGHLAGARGGALGVVAPRLGSAVVPISKVHRIELEAAGGALWGFTLIADYSDNRLVEVDEQGRELFVMEEVYGAWDVECLDSGNLLVTEFSVSRVQEVTRSGETVWSYDKLRNPYDADRLPNGNTLIADTFRGRVIEVSPQGEVVWEYSKGIRPFDCDRLANGNTLIADVLKERVIEVDRSGNIVWEKKNLASVHDADRLLNGNTLITLRTLNRVIEVDRSGKEVFRLSNLSAPSDADRLPNGNTLVAENNMVREFDRKGKLVWRREMTWAVEVNRY